MPKASAPAKKHSPSQAAAAKGAGNAANKITKKRPYRRTKRPPGYNDKSTITTTTRVAAVNAYDTVLQESQDLLDAAAEAQQLGRLKMASTYLLLLHARLVGLGKRFDKARDDHHHHKRQRMDETEASSAAKQTSNEDATAQQQAAASVPEDTPKTRAAKQLAKMLPSNIEMDQAMMEHLAKAAAELHAARTGRAAKRPDLLRSPDAREFLATTANRQGVTNAATAALKGIAWTEEEVKQLNSAMADGEKDPRYLAEVLPGRTEQQVKVYLHNQTERKRVSAMDLLPPPSGHVAATDAAAEAGQDGKQKSRGRGRKPATTAMNTVPNAICNARQLIGGSSGRDQAKKDMEASALL